MDYDIDRKAGDENIGNKLLIGRINDDICKAVQSVNDQNAAHFIEDLEPHKQIIIERSPLHQIDIGN